MTTVAKHVDKTSLKPPRRPAETTAEERDRARRYVASQSTCMADCRQLLEALGLGPVEGRWT